MEFLYVLLALQIKHLLLDVLLQATPRWRCYIDAGGLLHSTLSGIFTGLILWYGLSLPLAWLPILIVVDSVVHYHIDFLKNHFSLYVKNTALIDGIDQLLHQLTYILLIILVK